jgi:uncharacterized protein YyaL (SSP411 family)
MTVCLASPAAIGDPRLPTILSKLRADEHVSPNFRQSGYLEVEALLDARLVESARLAGSQSEIDDAVARCSRLSRCSTPNGLIRRQSDTDPGDLGDYLSYSDAMLQCFMATGRRAWLDQGMRRLREALQLFAGPAPGCYSLSLDRVVPDTNVPDVTDSQRESCSARIARLCLAYGRLLGNRDLLNRSRAVVSRLTGLATGPEGGYLNLAAAMVVDPVYALASGPDAVALARQLQRLRPARFCSPSAVRGRPGVYVDGRGPMSVAEAAALLPATLRSPDGS